MAMLWLIARPKCAKTATPLVCRAGAGVRFAFVVFGAAQMAMYLIRMEPR